jgi:hypothetical protein
MAAIGSSWASGSWVSVGGWAAGTWADAGAPTIPFYPDLNSLLYVFLCDYYSISASGADLTTLVSRYLAEGTGDYTNRWNAMVAAAIAATQ